ncbi:ABC transporter ATP-binding protein, partial [Bacteroides cellulosilyticus]
QLARGALLRAFATRPTVLLLDEVEAALDEESAVAVSRLTRAMLAGGAACLRIRHRAEDGYAYGVFTLADGKMTYHQNEITADNAPATSAGKGCDSRADEVLAKLKAVP